MHSVTETQIRLNQYESMRLMIDWLADRVTTVIAQAVEEQGQATLAVSGGSTPRSLYEHLTHLEAPWDRVVIVLVDERWVEPGTHGSNETFIRENLLQGEVKAARFIGLKTAGETPFQGLKEAQNRLIDIPHPFDAVLLGMGNDGHTASWFPNAKGLDEALAESGPRVAAIEANRTEITGPFTQRLTLTRSALSGAREIHLLLAGSEKRQTWEEVIGAGKIEDMPVRALLRDPVTPLQAHWAP